MGPIGLVVGILIVATADGGLGTGNGIAGGYLAIVVGLIGMALGGLALAQGRSHQRLGPEGVSHDHDDADVSRHRRP
jgi:hypothetical protein